MASHGRAGKNAVPPGNTPGSPSGPTPGQVLQGTEAAGAAGTKGRGRHARTTLTDVHAGPEAREGNVWQERQTESNRPIGNGGGKLRGDRQDMHPDPGMRGKTRKIGKRDNGVNRGLRTDRNPQSTAGRRNNRVPNEGG